MKTCLIGDVHGHIFHVLLLVALCQTERKEKYDLIIQVGDLGVWPDPDRADAATKRFAAMDPTEFDFQYLLRPNAIQRKFLSTVRRALNAPVLFIRGNHEDMQWLQEHQTGPIDDFGLFQYVADGAVVEREGMRIAFLGGIESAKNPAHQLRDDAFDTLMSLKPGSIDLLVTHDALYGFAKGYYGDIKGSQRISRLAEYLAARYHVFGHLHHGIGPLWEQGRVTLGLALVMEAIREEKDRLKQPVRNDCLAVIDHDEKNVQLILLRAVFI